jgi:replicative DNA helicase
MGKTTFSLNLAYNICGKSDLSVAFFSLEMTSAQLVKKVIADLSGVSNTAMRSGRIGDEGMNDLLEAARQLEGKRFFINDNSYLTIADLRNKCMKIQRREGLDIVFIDYLQLMHAGTNYRNSGNSKNGFQSRQEEIAEISRNIKGLAKDLNVPIIALSQLSREVENRKDAVPQLSDLRESGAIEQDADIVMFLSRPSKEELEDGINLTFAKHRNGMTGTLSFKFDKATSSFKEWDNHN